MTTPALLLIVWSAACLGLALASTKGSGEPEDFISNFGTGLILWSVGIGLWMIAEFVWRAVG